MNTTSLSRHLTTGLLLFWVERSQAVEFEKLGTAIAKVLGTKSAFQTTATVGDEKTQVFYSKNAGGKATKLAVIQKAIYEPNCTHTWVVGLDAAKATVEQIRVVEMSCPHAFPCNKESFLQQYTGKGPHQHRELASQVNVIAKATGSSELTTTAVKKSIEIAVRLRGKI